MTQIICQVCRHPVFRRASEPWRHAWVNDAMRAKHDDHAPDVLPDNEILAQLAKDAMDVQDACNLSGVAHSLYALCHALRSLGVSGTNEINTHPLVHLFVDKLVSLTGRQTSFLEFAKSWDAAKTMVAEGHKKAA